MTPQDFITKWGAPDGVPGPAYALIVLQPEPTAVRPELVEGVDPDSEARARRRLGAISKSEAHEPPASAPPLQVQSEELRQHAIANATKCLLALNLERSPG